MKTRSFVLDLLARTAIKKQHILSAAHKCDVDFEVLEAASQIDDVTPKDFVLQMFRSLNGDRLVRMQLYRRHAWSSKLLVKTIPFSPAEERIILSERAWNTTDVLIQLELHWWENRITMVEFIEAVRKEKHPSHSWLKNKVACIHGERCPNLAKIMGETLSACVSSKRLFAQLCRDTYDLGQIVDGLDKELPKRFGLAKFLDTGVYSTRVDLLSICKQQKLWSKNSFISKVFQVAHEAHYDSISD